MTGMSMPPQTWYGAAGGFLGMWMATMVPMMLPSLFPMLSGYRRSVRGADGILLHGLTALVAVGYFLVWAAWGGAAWVAGAGVLAAETRWAMVAQWLPVAAGVSHLNWDLRTQGITTFPGMIFWGASTSGPATPPGRYTVRLTADGKTLTAPLVVKRNPWITDVTDADLKAQYAFSRQVRDKVNDANSAVIEIRRVKAQVDDRFAQSDDAKLHSAGETLKTDASAVEEKVYQVRNQSNQDPLNFPIRVNNRLAALMSMAEAGDGRPTNNMPEIFGILSTELKGYLDELARVWARDLPAVNAELNRLGLPKVDPKCLKVKGCGVI